MRRTPAAALALLALLGLPGCGERASPPSASAELEAPEAVDPAPTLSESDCNPALTAEQCAAAIRSLEIDGQELAEDAASMRQSDAEREQEEAAQDRAVQDIRQQDCAEQQATLEALQRMQTRPYGEILSQEELDALPGEVTKTERYLADNCH